MKKKYKNVIMFGGIFGVILALFIFQNNIFLLLNKDKYVHNCLIKYKKTEDTLQVYKTVINGARDSINGWIKTGLSTTKSMSNSVWDIDSIIFFNDKYNKCIFLVPDVFGANNATDVCYILAGELIKDKWQFYYASYPANTFFRSGNQNKPYTRDYLVFEVQKDLFEDGLFNKRTGSINSSYIESNIWFADWIREMHKRFLRGEN